MEDLVIRRLAEDRFAYSEYPFDGSFGPRSGRFQVITARNTISLLHLSTPITKLWTYEVDDIVFSQEGIYGEYVLLKYRHTSQVHVLFQGKKVFEKEIEEGSHVEIVNKRLFILSERPCRISHSMEII